MLSELFVVCYIWVLVKNWSLMSKFISLVTSILPCVCVLVWRSSRSDTRSVSPMCILCRYELCPLHIQRVVPFLNMHKVYIQYQLFPIPTSLFPLMSGTPRHAAKEVRIIKRLRVWAWRWLMDCYREEMRQAAWGSWVAKQTSTLDNETLGATRVESRHTSREGNAFVLWLLLFVI